VGDSGAGEVMVVTGASATGGGMFLIGISSNEMWLMMLLMS